MSVNGEKKELSDAPEQGTNKILSSTFGVDAGEVDSVHGAKPEPEERPFFEHRVLEANKVQLSDGSLFTGAAQTVVIESDVNREMLAFGKQCGNCSHFNHAIGQGEIAQIEEMGNPEDQKMLKALRAQLLETGVVDAQGDYVGHTQVFHDETNKFVSEMGACLIGAAHQGGETQLLHPSQQGCPSKFADGTPWEWSYSPKDAETAKRDQLIFDNLMQRAARHQAKLKGTKVK